MTNALRHLRALDKPGVAIGLVPAAVCGLAFKQGSVWLIYAFGFLAIFALVMVALSLSDRSILLFGGLVMGIVGGPFTWQLPTPLISLYPTDIVLLLAVAAWVPGRLIGARNAIDPTWAWPRVLGWPFVLFTLAVVLGVVRGSEEYGSSLFSYPIRLFFYAAVVVTLTTVDSRKVHRGVTAVFYAGAAWHALEAVQHLAAGTSATRSVVLSTGGTRVVALSTSLFLAAALFLALLNLRAERNPRMRLLHIGVAGLALGGIVLAYGRGTFAAVALVLVILLARSPRIRTRIIAFAPVWVPALVFLFVAVPSVSSKIVPTAVDRVTGSLSDDSAVRWRQEANAAVWEQVKESPLIGVGFGRTAAFTVGGSYRTISQDPHNSYLYILAGAGAIALAGFLAMCAVYALDLWRRLQRVQAEHERTLLVWSGVTGFTFLVNALAEPLLDWPWVLFTIWTLLLLPSVVRPRPIDPVESGS